MKIHKYILIWILAKQNQKLQISEILEENSDLSTDKPLIDLATDQT